MGYHHKDGYSASVEGFLLVQGQRYTVAKSSDVTVTLAVPCEFPPGTEAEMVIRVDDNESRHLITLPDGVPSGQITVRYQVAAPF